MRPVTTAARVVITAMHAARVVRDPKGGGLTATGRVATGHPVIVLRVNDRPAIDRVGIVRQGIARQASAPLSAIVRRGVTGRRVTQVHRVVSVPPSHRETARHVRTATALRVIARRVPMGPRVATARRAPTAPPVARKVASGVTAADDFRAPGPSPWARGRAGPVARVVVALAASRVERVHATVQQQRRRPRLPATRRRSLCRRWTRTGPTRADRS